MITATSTVGTIPTTQTTTTNKNTLGKDQFLTLLVAQLRNQDPLNPLQAYEFAAQLAQFSSVEQLTQLNDGMTQQLAGTQLAAMLSKTAFSASLLGRQVSAEGDQVTVPASGHAQVRIEVGGSGGHAKLRLLDSAGREVATRDLGNLPSGRQTLELPSDLPAGTYRYEIKVTGPQDAVVPVTTYTSGIVDAVYFQDGDIVLRMGTMEVTLDAVTEIEPVATTPVTAGPPDVIGPPARRLPAIRDPYVKEVPTP